MLEWQNSYKVNIRKIDAQHRQLVRIINQLYSLSEGRNQGGRLEKVFEELRRYVQRHFHDEEQLMLKHAYPGLELQKKEHAAFIDRICEQQKSLLKNQPAVLINIFNNVWDWFAHHVLEVDKQYQAFFRERGVR